MTDTPLQKRVMEIVYAEGFVGPCGHHGPQMTIRPDGAVECRHVTFNRHVHEVNPEPFHLSIPAHTDGCREVICGMRFWLIPYYAIELEKYLPPLPEDFVLDHCMCPCMHEGTDNDKDCTPDYCGFCDQPKVRHPHAPGIGTGAG